MCEKDNITDVASLGIDYMGFIFYPPSPRYCIESICGDTVRALPPSVEPVAVVVDEDERKVKDLAGRFGFRTFQLHGNESPALCRRLKEQGFTILKAFGIKDKDDFRQVAKYEGCVDYFLFDTASASKGGSGKKFDWELLSDYSLATPFFLSGGIGVEDAEIIKEFHHPCFAGIDLNSRFEVSPGKKDAKALESFIYKMKKL